MSTLGSTSKPARLLREEVSAVTPMAVHVVIFGLITSELSDGGSVTVRGLLEGQARLTALVSKGWAV